MINVDLFNFINHNLQNPVLDILMPFYTNFGCFEAMLTFCIVAIIISVAMKNKKARQIACLCLISLLVADLIVLILKHIVAEPRPFVTLDNVRLLVVENDPYSFPSGHSSSTFAVLSTLIFKFRNKLLTVVLLFFALLMGFSRIYVGVHYPFDVLFGLIFGVLSAYIITKYEYKVNNFFDTLIGVLKK